MTRNELLKFVLENSNKILVRWNNGGGGWEPAQSFLYRDLSFENYEYIYIDELGIDEQPKKFEIEE